MPEYRAGYYVSPIPFHFSKFHRKQTHPFRLFPGADHIEYFRVPSLFPVPCFLILQVPLFELPVWPSRLPSNIYTSLLFYAITFSKCFLYASLYAVIRASVPFFSTS